ncbi:ComEA family DNA-binding protein [Marinomonas mediterranea]|jgi:competence protein ComEA helix-hairpin-helix repeat region|uniref:Competence protein ComEA helix-hairpin-helix repeat protein n=1 Tax=Marinomonas mediterranea (strain ATCC 700492 / JCM 21426 / NBRC 103028 / MMB-1) TaxID=717774 RepID=F2JZ13_MARM1|nr:helix-hairpin-helix domain-containing protein [Marinomonas mediterranea]ADZ91991.1 competence protein ComEA helix-hairpin-helix repeat protein [Marinomonas mediterranea MMB-1]WCN09935.1 helix-hairpin-helix domain-containing protein [Marinomonas mediterranea]WCN14017.1 helix-hairpin-helix domain-containing protein [Marinomonas mediterranea]WCN18068.1 helix-hairpin-helix domain-containing protein [Marinomonas mediterranea MMB-1]
MLNTAIQLWARTAACATLLLSLLCFSTAALAVTPLDVNAATAEELALILKGVGTSKAQAIVTYRNEHGAFASIEDLVNVKGIGSSLLEKNRSFIRVAKETD